MKKLLSTLFVFSLLSISSLNVVSCNQYNSLSKTTQQNDVINAINQYQNDNNNQITSKDINDINETYNFKNNKYSFNYDVILKQNSKVFNQNYSYRIPELKGSFSINKKDKKISNILLSINYLKGNYHNYISNIDNILTGTTNNFTLIMNSDDWASFSDWIFDNTKWNNNTGGNAFLLQLNLFNLKIILTNDEWISVLQQLTYISLDDHYAACIHVIKENNEFKVTYTNLTPKDFENIPLPSINPWIPLIAFESNEDIVNELKDIYTSYQNNESYSKENWNINSIIDLLKTNNYNNTNLSYETIAGCIFNNWNIELMNNFLAKSNYIMMQYDKDNNYIKNN